jgi:hypothetical protein
MYSLLRVCRQATQGDCTIGTLKAFIVSLVKPVAYLSFSVISTFEPSRIERALTILKKCYSRPVSITAETTLEIVRCVTKKQFFQARAFYLERVVESRRHNNLPSSILPEEDICFIALKNNQVVGLLHAKETKTRHLKLVAYESLDTEAEVKNLLLEAVGKAFPDCKPINMNSIT